MKKTLLINVIVGSFVILFNQAFIYAKQNSFVSQSVYAVDPEASCHNEVESRYMRSTRKDRHIPCDCKPFNIHQFKGSKINYYVQGIRSTKGADHKLDLNREEARDLWRAFNDKTSSGVQRDLIEKMSQDSRLLKFIKILEDAKKYQGFRFSSEGDVLEALAIADKEQTYSPPTFFVTGGVSYGKDKVVGELDILVYERLTCSVILVGEAKLGKGVSQARDQLARFRNFINNPNSKK